jgi:hypothetical protein
MAEGLSKSIQMAAQYGYPARPIIVFMGHVGLLGAVMKIATTIFTNSNTISYNT